MSGSGSVSLACMPDLLSLHVVTTHMPLAHELVGFTSFMRPLFHLPTLSNSRLLPQAITGALRLSSSPGARGVEKLGVGAGSLGHSPMFSWK